MANPRRTAFIAGTLYLLTVVTSIPALALKEPILTDPGLLAAAGGDTAIVWAVVLELILAAACIGTAVVLYPVVRRRSEPLALGFVAARIVEAGLIGIGVIGMLALVSIPRSDPIGLPAVDAALVAIHDWAFLLGPGLIPAANALLLGTVLYRARLVPRFLPLLGLIGAPLLAAAAVATLIGALDQVSPLAGVAALPIAFWEIGLGLWLVIRGFRPAALAALSAGHTAADTRG